MRIERTKTTFVRLPGLVKVVVASLVVAVAIALLSVMGRGDPHGLALADSRPEAVPPPDVASYVIDARYDPAAYVITATQTATYVNRTQDAIPDLVFHLYLNAFRNENTLWMREAGTTSRGYPFDPNYPGAITVDTIRLADGTDLTLEAVDPDETLARAALPNPVAPGEAVTVEMTYTALLPKVFARTGWADQGDFVMAGQWFPKFGVWQHGGWNAYPFHANSEFYADFGSYEVGLTLPQGWVVGTTGTASGDAVANADGTTTQHFAAEHVIDFAWGASPHFHVRTATVDGVRVEVFHYPDARAASRRAMRATVAALPHYEAWYGPYGGGLYPELTVILVPPGAGGAGGMEYPTLFTVGASVSPSNPGYSRFLEIETVHELAHQWFQSLVATNEAEEPWLDEGFAEYSSLRAFDVLYHGALWNVGRWAFSFLAIDRAEYVAAPDTTIAGTAWSFGDAYAIAAYAKPALSLTTLQRRVGDAAMVDFLGTYARRFAFSHPSADDLRGVMSETLGEETAAWFFDELVDSASTLDARAADPATTTFDPVREGQLCLPETVRVVEGGQVLEPVWPCGEPFPTALDAATSVDIDPDLVAILDLDLVNNGLSRRPDDAVWLGATVRMVQFLQVLFRGVSSW